MNNMQLFFKHSVTWLFFVGASLTLFGCGDAASKKMPEEIAYEFVEAIYNQKDFKIIQSHASDKLTGLIGHYRTVNMIQRHVMDLRLDSATIKISDVGGDFFRKSKKNTKIELHIRGQWNGGLVADDRFLTMTWEGKRWKVLKISKS